MTTQHTATPEQIERARRALIDCQGYEPSSRDLRRATRCVMDQDRISALKKLRAKAMRAGDYSAADRLFLKLDAARAALVEVA